MRGADPPEALADSKEAGVDSARSDQTEPYSGKKDPTMEPTASSQGAQQQTLYHKEGPAGSRSRSSATHATSVQIVRGPAELEEGSSYGTSYVGGEEQPPQQQQNGQQQPQISSQQHEHQEKKRQMPPLQLQLRQQQQQPSLSQQYQRQQQLTPQQQHQEKQCHHQQLPPSQELLQQQSPPQQQVLHPQPPPPERHHLPPPLASQQQQQQQQHQLPPAKEEGRQQPQKNTPQHHHRQHQLDKKEADQGSNRDEGGPESPLPPNVGTSGDNNSEKDQAFQTSQTGEQSPSSLTTKRQDNVKYTQVRQFTLLLF